MVFLCYFNDLFLAKCAIIRLISELRLYDSLVSISYFNNLRSALVLFEL